MDIKFNYFSGTSKTGYPIQIDDKTYYFTPGNGIHYGGLTDVPTVSYTQVSALAGNWKWNIDGNVVETIPQAAMDFFDPMGVFSKNNEFQYYFPQTTPDKKYFKMNSFLHPRYIDPRVVNNNLIYSYYNEAPYFNPGTINIDFVSNNVFSTNFQALMSEEYRKDLFTIGLTTDVDDLTEYSGKGVSVLFDEFEDNTYSLVLTYSLSTNENRIDKNAKIFPAWGYDTNKVYTSNGTQFLAMFETTLLDLFDENVVKSTDKPGTSNDYWKLNTTSAVFEPYFNNSNAAIDISLKGFEFRSNNRTVLTARYFPAKENPYFITYQLSYVYAPFVDKYSNKAGGTNINKVNVYKENNTVVLRYVDDKLYDYNNNVLGTTGKWVGEYSESGFTMKYEKILETDIAVEDTFDITVQPYSFYSDYILLFQMLNQTNGYTNIYLGKDELRTDFIAYDPQATTICI